MAFNALITGASGGIGRSLCYEFAENGCNLVVVARNSEILEDLKADIQSKYGVDVEAIPMDLSMSGSGSKLYDAVNGLGLDIEYLVNNAGFGDFGKYSNRSWDKYESMIDLNIKALSELTHIFLKDMAERGSGRIMNVASMLAFQSGPYWAMYSATKAFVLSLTEALAEEYRDSGVTFTALCPGLTDTGFRDASESSDSGLFRYMSQMTPEKVARFGYRKMMSGAIVVIPGFINNMLILMSKMFPRQMVTRIFTRLQ